MKKYTKTVISSILAVIIMAAMLAVPVGATAAQGVDIYFNKPASWNDSVNIHLWNAGSYNTQWPGISMTSLGGGWYKYTNGAINSCSIVISDNTGNQTDDLNVTGQVTVQDNKVVAREQKYIALNFTRPDNWGTDVKVYYYSDDSNALAIYDWPGVSMTSTGYANQYTCKILEMSKARVVFTDGVNQYPPQGHAGIPVEAGQYVACKTDGTVTKTISGYTGMEASKSTVTVNEEFTITTYGGGGFSQWISSVGSGMQVVTYSMQEGKVVYTVKFTEAGYKTVCTGYSVGYGGDMRAHERDGCIAVDIMVL